MSDLRFQIIFRFCNTFLASYCSLYQTMQGFGVCCLFLLAGYNTITQVSGQTARNPYAQDDVVHFFQNCTYARNTNYPSTESASTSGTVTFSRICSSNYLITCN